DGCVESEGLEDCFADTFREGCGIFCRGLKNYVSTLDVRPYVSKAETYVSKAETFTQSAKNFHLDCVVSAYVDAAQHRDVRGHSLNMNRRASNWSSPK